MATVNEQVEIILDAYQRGFDVPQVKEADLIKVPELPSRTAAMLGCDRWVIVSIFQARGKTGVEEVVRMLPDALPGKAKAMEFMTGYLGEQTVIDMANGLFRRAQQKLEASYGRATTHRGPIQNDKHFKKDFPLTHALAKKTGCDFVAMTVVLQHAGRLGLERIFLRTPKELPQREDAIRMVKRDGLLYGEGQAYLDEVAPPTMEPRKRAEIILKELRQAYELKYGEMQVRDTLDSRDRYGICGRIADLLDMDFAYFVIPFRKGGSFALEQVIELLPDGLEGKGAALREFL